MPAQTVTAINAHKNDMRLRRIDLVLSSMLQKLGCFPHSTGWRRE